MALNLIKLCVGADSVRDLEDWIKEKLRDKRKRREKKLTDSMDEACKAEFALAGPIRKRDMLMEQEQKLARLRKRKARGDSEDSADEGDDGEDSADDADDADDGDGEDEEDDGNGGCDELQESAPLDGHSFRSLKRRDFGASRWRPRLKATPISAATGSATSRFVLRSS